MDEKFVKDENLEKFEQLVESKVPKKTEQGKGLPIEDSILYDEVMEKIQNRRKEQVDKKKKGRKKTKIILSVIVFIVGMFIFSFSSFFDVDSIDVVGNSYFTAEEIVNMAHAEPGKNLIYHPDKGSIVKYLEDNPYIKKAKVSRGLPSTLIITVLEREQIAAIKYDDDYLIIDDTGYLLRKTRTVPKVTVIQGIKISKIKVDTEIGVEDKVLLEQTLDILKAMRDHDLFFVDIDMSNMYIKADIYDNLICKGTYQQLLDALNKDRLHKVLDKLFKQGIRRGTITFSDEGYASFLPTV